MLRLIKLILNVRKARRLAFFYAPKVGYAPTLRGWAADVSAPSDGR